MSLDLLPPEMQAQALRQIAPERAARMYCPAPDTADAGPERELQAAAERELRARGWEFWHVNGKSAIGNQDGWPDLLCFGPNGRVALIELKTAKGKLSQAQTWRHEKLAGLGHPVHVCRSLRGVIELLEAEPCTRTA